MNITKLFFLFLKQSLALLILNRGLWSVVCGVAHGLGSSEPYDSYGAGEEGGDYPEVDGVGSDDKESDGGGE
ncbi:hypothetical protein M0802_010202 [Mischocyttarus mexicanus]|nr:hypothetical protein M0802_010202 [Mischocyttarus mexicanus]